MTFLVNYLIGATTFMAVLYICYILLLSNDTHYARNRAYLLLSLVLSLVLPLIRINISNTGGVFDLQNSLSRIIVIDQVNISPDGGSINTGNSLNFLLLTYLSGVLVTLLLTLFYTIRIYRIIKNGKIEGSRKVYTNFNNISGFSAFGYIFLSTRLDQAEEERIEQHEQKHIDQKHFFDLIFIKILSIVFWFNPFIYLFNRSIQAVHEYQADAKMIDSGENPASYTRLLLNQVFRTRLFTIQNAFANKTLIKKRIIMMTKQKTRNVAALKLLLILPLTLIIFFIFSCTQDDAEPKVQQEDEIEFTEQAPADNFKSNDKTERAVFVVVDDMPTFMGGDINKFREWVQRNVKYPQIAAEKGIQGKVFVVFVVNEDGTVSGAEILKGVDPILDNETLRVVNSSPLWVAGKQSGIEVAVKFSITVNFQLN